MGYTPPQLEVRRVAATGYNVMPPNSTTGEDIKIYPNTTDTDTYIRIRGNSTIEVNANTEIYFKVNAVSHVIFSYSAPDCQISSPPGSNRNISLLPDGTGKLKFGVYDATPALASSGFIPFLDAAGNARKMMIQA